MVNSEELRPERSSEKETGRVRSVATNEGEALCREENCSSEAIIPGLEKAWAEMISWSELPDREGFTWLRQVGHNSRKFFLWLRSGFNFSRLQKL